MGLFPQHKFYCVYCVCFSSLNENRLVKGIEYVKNCRITETLISHGKELHHKKAIEVYSRIVSNHGKIDGAHESENRNAIKCIVKIIIFIATHGECYDTSINCIS